MANAPGAGICPDSPVLNSHPLSSEVLRHGSDSVWGGRTSQTAGIAGDRKLSGQWWGCISFPLAGINTI